MRTGLHGQLEYTTGPMTVYAGGGFSLLTGQSVASNNRTEANAGLSYSILKSPGSSLTVSADLTYLAYQKNLSNFIFGQGGYFSPQSYAGINLPIDYRAKIGDLSYHLGATLGYATWHSRSSALFPNDHAYQSALLSASTADPSIATSYPGQSRSGVTGGLRADLDYAITPTWHIGATASYDRTADWNEARGLFYIKQSLQPWRFNNLLLLLRRVFGFRFGTWPRARAAFRAARVRSRIILRGSTRLFSTLCLILLDKSTISKTKINQGLHSSGLPWQQSRRQAY